jgi:hypothetical protein
VHVQDGCFVNGFCSSPPKTLLLEHRLCSRMNCASLELGLAIFTTKILWSDVIPNPSLSYHQQQQFFVRLCAEILGDCLIGSHMLPKRVSGCNYNNFLRWHLNGLLKDAVSIWAFNTTVLHHITVVKYISGCPKIILGFELIPDVKLQFPSLHAHLTWIPEMVSVGMLDRSVPIQSIIEKKSSVEANKLEVK